MFLIPLLTSPRSERITLEHHDCSIEAARTRSRSPPRLSEPLRIPHEMMLLNDDTPLKLRFRTKECSLVTCSNLSLFPSHPQHPNSNQLFRCRQNPTFKGLQRVPRQSMRKETPIGVLCVTIRPSGRSSTVWLQLPVLATPPASVKKHHNTTAPSIPLYSPLPVSTSSQVPTLSPSSHRQLP